jgi:hypothetical protein
VDRARESWHSCGCSGQRKRRATFRQLGDLGVLRGVYCRRRRRGGGEDPWLCAPGFRRVGSYRGLNTTVGRCTGAVNQVPASSRRGRAARFESTRTGRLGALQTHPSLQALQPCVGRSWEGSPGKAAKEPEIVSIRQACAAGSDNGLGTRATGRKGPVRTAKPPSSVRFRSAPLKCCNKLRASYPGALFVFGKVAVGWMWRTVPRSTSYRIGRSLAPLCHRGKK